MLICIRTYVVRYIMLMCRVSFVPNNYTAVWPFECIFFIVACFNCRSCLGWFVLYFGVLDSCKILRDRKLYEFASKTHFLGRSFGMYEIFVCTRDMFTVGRLQNPYEFFFVGIIKYILSSLSRNASGDTEGSFPN